MVPPLRIPPIGENFLSAKYEKTRDELLNCCLFGETSNVESLAIVAGGTLHKSAEELMNTTPPLIKSVMVSEPLDRNRHDNNGFATKLAPDTKTK